METKRIFRNLNSNHQTQRNQITKPKKQPPKRNETFDRTLSHSNPEELLAKIQQVIISFLNEIHCIVNNKPFITGSLFTKKTSLTKLAQSFVVLKAIQEAIQLDINITLRHIFYLDKDLFKTQSVVSHIVSDFATKIFGYPKEVFHVVASQKGYVCGNIQLTRPSKTFSLSSSEESIIPQIPQMKNCIPTTSASYILIVEKYTIFKSLIHSDWYKRNNEKVIVITGCGFPDCATKFFINVLLKYQPLLQIYCLVDFDPFGIDIFKNYIRLDADYPIVEPISLLLFDFVEKNVDKFPISTRLELEEKNRMKLTKMKSTSSISQICDAIDSILRMNFTLELEAIPLNILEELLDFSLPLESPLMNDCNELYQKCCGDYKDFYPYTQPSFLVPFPNGFVEE